MISLRVLNGARAGVHEQFEKSVVSVGRHPLSDLRFDPQADLDVSTRHAEFRGVNDTWRIVDLDSTNGTYVNGARVPRERTLRDGDVVSFGAHGPQVQFRLGSLASVANEAPRTSLNAQVSPATPVGGEPARKDTSVRVAEAVEAQTRTMRRVFAGTVISLVAIGGGVFLLSQRASSARQAQLLAIIARNESTTVAMQRTIDAVRPSDPVFAKTLEDRMQERQREIASGRELLAGRSTTKDSVALLSERMSRSADVQRSLAQMDFTRVHDLNDPAVAMIASDLDGQVIAGTAFGVTSNGLLVTNRHVVRTNAGAGPKRIGVIFANTREWMPAHVVRVSDADDLALLQLDVPGTTYPVVAGVSRAAAHSRAGAPVSSIGYPGAVDLPMEGHGLAVTARSTTTAGTISKRLDDVLQIDSYAGHGSSGSPVFDTSGNVIGVIYGGAPESNGRIVYAVPAERLAAFIAGEAPGILR